MGNPNLSRIMKKTLDDLTSETRVLRNPHFTILKIVEQANQRHGCTINLHDHRMKERVEEWLNQYVAQGEVSRLWIVSNYELEHSESKPVYRSTKLYQE
ncbi:hypothetical protein J4210_04440 [Candidatus Woesearchaeota archaeon]|nr:hypothetical protein [Candidatus Woesearchaeota archaeon]